MAPQSSTYSQFVGRTPLLVVGSINGKVIVLQAPDKAYVNRSADAAVPAGSLTVAIMRAQSRITALATAQTPALRGSDALNAHARPPRAPGTAAADEPAAGKSYDGSFWVFVACADKSVRRFRLVTDSQRAAAKGTAEPPRHALMASQNFQVGAGVC